MRKFCIDTSKSEDEDEDLSDDFNPDAFFEYGKKTIEPKETIKDIPEKTKIEFPRETEPEPEVRLSTEVKDTDTKMETIDIASEDVDVGSLIDSLIEEESDTDTLTPEEESFKERFKLVTSGSSVTKILIIVGSLIVILLLVLIFKMSLSTSDNNQDKQTQQITSSQTHQSVIPSAFKGLGLLTVANDLTAEETLYSDYLIVEKKILTWDTMSIPLICGTTTKSKLAVKIPVSVEEFNQHNDGEILEIFLQKININNKEYLTNPTMGSIIGE